MKSVKNFIILFFLLGMSSCIPNKDKVLVELNVEFVERITEFPDSSFFSDVRMMEYENGRIYLLDAKRGDLVSLTEDFKQMEIEAPHSEIDLVMPVSFNVENDTLYVCDYGSVKTLKTYLNGRKIQSVSSFRFNEMRMAMDDSFIWASAPTDTSCFIKFNKRNPNQFLLAGNVIKEDKERIVVKNSKHFFYRNNNELYAVSEAYTYIEKYDTQTESLKELYDISDNDFIKANLEYAERQNLGSKTYLVYVMDACLYGNDLFVLCPSFDDPYRCNMLFKIDVGGEKMRIAGYYELPGNVYRSICVSDEYLFAAYHGRDCAIEKYKLNEN